MSKYKCTAEISLQKGCTNRKKNSSLGRVCHNCNERVNLHESLLFLHIILLKNQLLLSLISVNKSSCSASAIDYAIHYSVSHACFASCMP